uniref:Uncharacterized protein n=1 Tax=Vibrio tasmaniensis TaxID=212663 RepID=A0A0H3ZWS0_9VIBR|nr:hypothetical protein [Vibrio tasmaniensis]AKN40735.1 hypothetical protein [Vibrio tasmaniensis]
MSKHDFKSAMERTLHPNPMLKRVHYWVAHVRSHAFWQEQSRYPFRC